MSDNTERDERFKKMIAREQSIIAEFGFSVRCVGASENSPQFAYTLGASNLIGFELIVFALSPQIAHSFLNSIVTDVVNGEVITPGQIEVDNKWVDGFPILFEVTTSPKLFTEYALGVKNMLGTCPPFYQMVICDKSGKFPKEEGFDPQLAEAQPLLY